MSSFFLKNDKGKGKKRKKSDPKKSQQKLRPKKRAEPKANEEIDSESDEDVKNDPFRDLGIDDAPSDLEETPAEKRLRLANDYLKELQEEEKEDDVVDYDAIAHRLKEDALEQSGKLQKKVADQFIPPTDNGESIRLLKGHRLSLTAVCLTPDDKYAFTGSKDCSIIKWNIFTGQKEIVIPGCRRGLMDGAIGHTGHVLALAISSDGQYLASGGTDNVVHIWNAQTCLPVHTFKGHKGSITGLAFQAGTHELFSCSLDRAVKVWNVDELAYIETLFGHQDAVTSIDCLSRERPVTAGANDRTLRVWKVIEESQLVFNGHKASIDVVKMINNDYFVSGSQDGTLVLWNVTKKKALATVRQPRDGTPSSYPSEHWITALTTLPYTDLLASGSDSGLVHFWKCGEGFRSLDHLFSIPLAGFVNGLKFSKTGDFLVACIGQEHKLGRWWKNKDCKNGLAIIPLSKN